MGQISEETKGALERFIEEQEAAKQVSPEMEQVRENSLELLKSRAKVNSYKEVLNGLEAMEDDDSRLIQEMLDKTVSKVAESEATLKESVEALSNGEHLNDFVNVAKRTRFATSTKPIEAHTFASQREEVITRIDENINEQILLTNPEYFAELLAEEKNDNIRRFVGMYQKRAVSLGLGGWLEDNIADDVQKRRAIEHLEEMKGKTHFKGTIETLIGRWLNMSSFLSDKTKTDDEKREYYEKTKDFLFEEFLKDGYRVMGI